jgi:hypothetical protein
MRAYAQAELEESACMRAHLGSDRRDGCQVTSRRQARDDGANAEEPLRDVAGVHHSHLERSLPSSPCYARAA